jgi:glycosyltransferase involved in cell wall biosynthesis
MIGTALRVLRTEGARSAWHRASERVAESVHRASLLARPAGITVPILNVSMMGVAPRLGGVPTQLFFRLREERRLRDVALYAPGFLELPAGGRRVGSVREALAITGARVIHLEGTFGARLSDFADAELIVSVHETGAPRELLEAARVVVYPSRFLREHYGIEGEVIEPGVPLIRPSGTFSPPGGEKALARALAPRERGEGGRRPGEGLRIAFAGAVQRHKGAHLLPELAERVQAEWHAFGGGDFPLPRNIRRHGYYRAGALPALLRRYRIGRVVLPSIIEESFSLVLSECWQAGVPVVAFDHGAVAERIRAHGGGLLAPLSAGAVGLAELLTQDAPPVPQNIPTSAGAAKAYLSLYRRCTMLAVQ